MAVATGVADGFVDLFWLPLGAGGRSVALNGRAYEAIAARVAHREPCDLYHSALKVGVDGSTYVVEQAPVLPRPNDDRGVVAVGPVGTRWAGRLALFRYEIRLWRDGRIADIGEAVESPLRLTSNDEIAHSLLRSVPNVPTPVWGRDELATGEMWNSNSVIAWALARSGIDASSVRPPSGGRAPGWDAGVAVAHRGSPARARTARNQISRFHAAQAAQAPDRDLNRLRTGDTATTGRRRRHRDPVPAGAARTRW